jgi:hypothetical protein
VLTTTTQRKQRRTPIRTAARGHSVQMVEYATLAVPPGNGTVNLTGYTLGAAGPVLMVTGLLNGCTFCMLKQGAQVICAHIRPPGGANAGKDLHSRMMNRARMVGHRGSPLVCFGRNDYPGNATVVGVRLHGEWKIFAGTRPFPELRRFCDVCLTVSEQCGIHRYKSNGGDLSAT